MFHVAQRIRFPFVVVGKNADRNAEFSPAHAYTVVVVGFLHCLTSQTMTRFLAVWINDIIMCWQPCCNVSRIL